MSDISPAIMGGFTDKGPVRSANEDSFALPTPSDPTELGILVIVADGVGGQEHGALASQTAVNTMRPHFYEAVQQGIKIEDALKNSAEAANLAVYEKSATLGAERMGCTLVAVVQKEDRIWFGHVGDARLYLLREGQLKQLTRDDTWVQRQVDAGILTPEQAATHELRNVVTRVMGNSAEFEATYSGPDPVQPGDTLMLCSDGLYDVVSAEAIASILSRFPPQEASEQLVQAAIEAEATDNITAVVLSIDTLAQDTVVGGGSGAAAAASAAAVADDMADAPTQIVQSPIESDAQAETHITGSPVTPDADDPDATRADAPKVVPPPSAPEPEPEPAAPPPKSGRGCSWPLILLGVLLLVVVLAALAYFFMRGGLPGGVEPTAAIPTAVPTAIVPTESLPATATTAATPTLLPTDEGVEAAADSAEGATTTAESAEAESQSNPICLATVTNTEGAGLSLRVQPSSEASRRQILDEGTQVNVSNEAVIEDDITWRRVTSLNQVTGWASDAFLVPVPPCVFPDP